MSRCTREEASVRAANEQHTPGQGVGSRLAARASRGGVRPRSNALLRARAALSPSHLHLFSSLLVTSLARGTKRGEETQQAPLKAAESERHSIAAPAADA